MRNKYDLEALEKLHIIISMEFRVQLPLAISSFISATVSITVLNALFLSTATLDRAEDLPTITRITSRAQIFCDELSHRFTC
jgi:hypothetical protein